MVGKNIIVTNMIFNGFNLDSKVTFYLSFTRNRKGGKFLFSKKQYLEAEAGFNTLYLETDAGPIFGVLVS